MSIRPLNNPPFGYCPCMSARGSAPSTARITATADLINTNTGGHVIGTERAIRVIRGPRYGLPPRRAGAAPDVIDWSCAADEHVSSWQVSLPRNHRQGNLEDVWWSRSSP